MGYGRVYDGPSAQHLLTRPSDGAAIWSSWIGSADYQPQPLIPPVERWHQPATNAERPRQPRLQRAKFRRNPPSSADVRAACWNTLNCADLFDRVFVYRCPTLDEETP